MNRKGWFCASTLVLASLAAGVAEEKVSVPFEVGKRAFNGGDDISVVAIEGPSKEIRVGGTYRIVGTYKLGSKDEATLAVSVTAKKREDGIGPWSHEQRVTVRKGSGTFELTLPVRCEGWPHVSFYSGKSFGGVYMGTGETVLKE